jgi:hypothetical protein
VGGSSGHADFLETIKQMFVGTKYKINIFGSAEVLKLNITLCGALTRRRVKDKLLNDGCLCAQQAEINGAFRTRWAGLILVAG